MSELAVVAQALERKQEDKARIQKEVIQWEELQQSGVHGRLSMTLEDIHIKGGASVAATLLVKYLLKASGEVVNEEADAAQMTLCAVKETFTVQMRSKESSTIHFFGTVTSGEPDAAATVATGSDVSEQSFTASFDCKEAPEDTSLTCQLDTTSSTIVFNIKVSYDSCEAVLNSKSAELHQNEADLVELRTQLKKVSTTKPLEPPASTSSKRKSPKKSAASIAADDDESPPTTYMARASRFCQAAMQTASQASHSLVESRAYFLFAAAAASIFYYGEFASI